MVGVGTVKSIGLKLFQEEMHRMYCRRYGGFLLMICIVIYALACLNLPAANGDLEKNKESWHRISKPFYGELSSEKQEMLEQMSTDRLEKKKQLASLQTDFALGKIHPDVYREQLSKLQDIDESKEAFSVLFNQYIYARSSPYNRYIFYSNFWSMVLTFHLVDMVLPVLLILLTAPVFGEETQNCMWPLILAGSSGKRIFQIKFIYIIFNIFMLSFLFMGIKFVAAMFRFGINDPVFPVQSLIGYSGSELPLSLFATWALLFILKVTGLICLLSFVAFCSYRITNYSYTVTAGMSLILFPYLVTRFTLIGYLLGPYGLIFAESLLANCTDRPSTHSPHIRPIFLGIYVLGMLLLCFLISCNLRRRTTNTCLSVPCANKPHRILRHQLLLFMTAGIVMTYGGCVHNDYIMTKNGSEEMQAKDCPLFRRDVHLLAVYPKHQLWLFEATRENNKAVHYVYSVLDGSSEEIIIRSPEAQNTQ